MSLPINNPLSSPGQIIGRLEDIHIAIGKQQNDCDEAAKKVNEADDQYASMKGARDLEAAGIRLDQTGTVQEREDKTIKKLVNTDTYKQAVAAEVNLKAAKLFYERQKDRAKSLEAQASIDQSILRAQTGGLS